MDHSLFGNRSRNVQVTIIPDKIWECLEYLKDIYLSFTTRGSNSVRGNQCLYLSLSATQPDNYTSTSIYSRIIARVTASAVDMLCSELFTRINIAHTY